MLFQGQKMYILIMAIYTLLLSCGSPQDNHRNQISASSPEIISSIDSSEYYEASLILTDSFTYQLPDSQKIFNGRAFVFNEDMLYAHYAENEILRFDNQGNLLARMGGTGKGPGEFSSLIAVSKDSEFIYGFGYNTNHVNKYNYQGTFIDRYEWKTYYNNKEYDATLEKDWGQFYNFNGKFITRIQPIDVQKHTFDYYREPLLGIRDESGELVYVLGEYDEIYTREKPLPHFYRIMWEYDVNTQNIFISQYIADLLDVYDLKGEMLYRFGLPGKFMSNPNFIYEENIDMSVGFDATFEFQIQQLYETSLYDRVIVVEDYIVRFYRNGVPNKSVRSFWDKPLFYQIYNREGHLLADKKAPRNWFFPRGKSLNNHIWFAYENVIWDRPLVEKKTDKFHNTIYKYHIQVIEK